MSSAAYYSCGYATIMIAIIDGVYADNVNLVRGCEHEQKDFVNHSHICIVLLITNNASIIEDHSGLD